MLLSAPFYLIDGKSKSVLKGPYSSPLGHSLILLLLFLLLLFSFPFSFLPSSYQTVLKYPVLDQDVSLRTAPPKANPKQNHQAQLSNHTGP